MNLYESLLERLNGREYNGYFSANCVFHDDSNPSMFVYQDGTFRCSACGTHGTLKYLERRIGMQYHISRSDTVSNILPKWKKWEEQYGCLEEIASYAHQTLKRYPQFQGYYKRRKVDGYIQKGNLGYIDGWACIPVYDSSEKIKDMVVRAIKGKGDTRYVVKPSENACRPLYVPNWVRVQASEIVYVVYGMFDAISMELCGLPVVTGLTGKSLSAELLRPLGKRFIIIPDYHEDQAAHRLANDLGWRGKVQELQYPDDCKDVDDIHRIYGNETLRNLIGV